MTTRRDFTATALLASTAQAQTGRPSVIDAHSHLPFRLTPEVVDADRMMLDTAARLGIDQVCVFILSPERPVSLEGFRKGNRALAKVTNEFPGKILGYCFVNPGYGARALEEIRHYVESEGFIGIKIYNDYLVTDPVMAPVLELAGKLRVPVLQHAGHTSWLPSPQPNISDAGHIAEAARRFPETMWTEFISPETIDSRMWPKSAAVAERLWSAAEVNDVADMYRRLDVVSHRLTFAGARHETNYEPMLRRIAPAAPLEALRTFADALDPTGIEHREVFQRYTQETELNRMADAVRGDSAVVRTLEADVREWLWAPTAGREAAIRRVLEAWRDNDARLAPFGPTSSLLREFLPLSQELADLGAAGLQAMDRLAARRADSAWARGQADLLERTRHVRLEVRMAAARPVRLLVEAVNR
ncbi:MAG: hypothetical protein FJW30_09750 [Acidobacteria bacterium]|nr:hypothetical protein [Acidobacteriota bacterium]